MLGNNSNVGQCRLCLQNKELLRRSHVIPNFLYDGIFDSKQVLYRINLKDIKKQTGFIAANTSRIYSVKIVMEW